MFNIQSLSKHNFSTVEFPYKFGNTVPFVPQINFSLNTKRKLGFVYIYKHFLKAIHEKDFQYIHKVTEEDFGNDIIDSIKNFKSKIFLNDIQDDEQITHIHGVNVSFHYGRALARKDYINQTQKQMKRFKLPFMSKTRDYLANSFFIYSERANKGLIIRFEIDFRSNLILGLSQTRNKSSYEIHNIVLESPVKDVFEMIKYAKKEVEPDYVIANLDNFLKI